MLESLAFLVWQIVDLYSFYSFLSFQCYFEQN